MKEYKYLVLFCFLLQIVQSDDSKELCDQNKSTTNTCYLISLTLTASKQITVDCSLKEYSIIGEGVQLQIKEGLKKTISFKISERCDSTSPGFKFR